MTTLKRPKHITLKGGAQVALFEGEYGFELEVTPHAPGVDQYITLHPTGPDVLALRDALVEFAG